MADTRARLLCIILLCSSQVTAGKVLFDPLTQKSPVLHQIYRKRFVDTWSSRQMLETIRNKKSKEAAISKRDVRASARRSSMPLEYFFLFCCRFWRSILKVALLQGRGVAW
jgi:hypothetical protein